MTKVELHKIELQVAEFEISIMEDGVGDEGGYEAGGVCGEPVTESARADATDSKAFAGGTGQELGQWAPSNFEDLKPFVGGIEHVRKVTEDPQACGDTKQAVHNYRLAKEQSVLWKREVDRLEDIAESKIGPTPQQEFLGGTQQAETDPSAPSDR